MANVKPSGCTVTIDGDKLAIDGTALPDLRVATLTSVLGAPDRVEAVKRAGHYEESGADPGDQWTSTPYTATDYYYVYDRRGLVFHNVNGFMESSTEPDRMLVFFPSPRTFDNTDPPGALPASRTCAFAINGTTVDTARDLRPANLDAKTQRFALFGMTFGPTSIAMQIDSLYSIDGKRSITIFLDAPSTGRASYAVVR